MNTNAHESKGLMNVYRVLMFLAVLQFATMAAGFVACWVWCGIRCGWKAGEFLFGQ